MVRRFGSFVALATFIALLAVRAATHDTTAANLVVHEWGTFTSIAGDRGEAIEWLPQGAGADLPCFVNRLAFVTKGALSGTVRMETPVLYFYSPERITVDVHVRFPEGIVSEWFPRATVTPSDNSLFSSGNKGNGSIAWQQVTVAPNGPDDFPMDTVPTHYYAARQTESAPLSVGSQREKFLFYRGVGQFAPPVTAIAAGGSVRVAGRAADPIPDVVLFDNHAGSIAVQQLHGVSTETTLDALVPADVAPIKGEVEAMLVANGLYPAEAAAMVATWGDAWFEEGTRLFYILPSSAVDALLPLDIAPAPATIARVFVGRVELMSDATRRTVKTALLANDRATLAKYSRFLEAIGAQILKESSPAERPAIQAAMNRTFDLRITPQPSCVKTSD
jgi:hypothetical protein